jgi:hypothetical protein
MSPYKQPKHTYAWQPLGRGRYARHRWRAAQVPAGWLRHDPADGSPSPEAPEKSRPARYKATPPKSETPTEES